ncbi:MAG TPA: PilN domain-containing protein [Burkholderiaceae bacterium]
MSGQINLFNPIFLKQKKHFSARTMAQAMAVVLIGTIAMSAYMRNQLAALEQQASRSSASLAAAQKRLERVNAEFVTKPKNVELEGELANVEAELRSLQAVSGILQKGEFGNKRGYAEYLRAFARQAREGLWLTGFEITGAGTEIVLRGRALQPDVVPAFIARLSAEPVFKGKAFAGFEMQAGKGTDGVAAPYVDFELRTSLAEVAEPAARADAAERVNPVADTIARMAGK